MNLISQFEAVFLVHSFSSYLRWLMTDQNELIRNLSGF